LSHISLGQTDRNPCKFCAECGTIVFKFEDVGGTHLHDLFEVKGPPKSSSYSKMSSKFMQNREECERL
jgi:hypothetical protein